MGLLDEPARRERLDPGRMLDAIRDLPRQCRAAWEEAQAFSLPPRYRGARRLAVLGMGGSAIAGDYLRALGPAVPMASVRSYDIPPWVDGECLVIASSYSGNTEETLSAFQQALSAGALVVAVTSGGRLAELARSAGVPLFRFHYSAQPRAALGYSLMPLLAIAHQAGLLPDPAPAVAEAIALLERERERLDAVVPSEANPAKRLAERLHGRLPVVYGGGHLVAVAQRWKTQLNENAKVWAFYEELPEANHNAILGYGLPPQVARLACVVFLRSPALHPRVLLRYQFTAQALAEASVGQETVEVPGESALAQLLAATLMGDYVSYYLALLNQVDPTPVPTIDALKAWLASR